MLNFVIMGQKYAFKLMVLFILQQHYLKRTVCKAQGNPKCEINLGYFKTFCVYCTLCFATLYSLMYNLKFS